MKAVRNMVNSFAELKVCAETVELLKQMGIKKADACSGTGYTGLICRP